jgi:hypothetical protein
MEEETRALEISDADSALIELGMALVLRYTEERIERHRNHKDYSMDKLFSKMETLIRAGDLWARVKIHQGMTPEEVALLVRELPKDG